jgi:phosphoribosylamine--glycine ligase
MKVLILGQGGREHAIAHKLSLSPMVDKVYVYPGNPGMDSGKLSIESLHYLNLNHQDLVNFCKNKNVDLTIVGPEVYLSEGIVDLFNENNLLIVGPTKAASRLESSKVFAKEIMSKSNVPTASYGEFRDAPMALKYIENSSSEKMVVKCNGLAAGKGVVVCLTKEEAKKAVTAFMLEAVLGFNEEHIIIEEYLEGSEVSVFALCDGEDFINLGSACDHKRLREGNLGPNTGGMGTYAPCPFLSENDHIYINQNIFSPVLKTMKQMGFSFNGILFAGLMKTKDGLKVLEFNVRLGDPETQSLLPLINEDIAPMLLAAAQGQLANFKQINHKSFVSLKNQKAVHIVLAAFGYPGTEGITVRSGDKITISENFRKSDSDFLYFSGVKQINDDLVTNGGRVMGITALAESFSLARSHAYENCELVEFSGLQKRSDIAKGVE